MPITSEITVTINSANLPSNYDPTPPSNVFVSPTVLTVTRDEPIAAIPDPDGKTAVDNLTAAVLSWLDTVYYPAILKLDATKTIIATASVTDIRRVNDTLNPIKDQYFPGAEVFRTTMIVKWE
jgi:hypothetical protein